MRNGNNEAEGGQPLKGPTISAEDSLPGVNGPAKRRLCGVPCRARAYPSTRSIAAAISFFVRTPVNRSTIWPPLNIRTVGMALIW